MAREVTRLFAETNVRETRLFIMAGHEAGVIAFGGNLAEAFDVLAMAALPGRENSAASISKLRS